MSKAVGTRPNLAKAACAAVGALASVVGSAPVASATAIDLGAAANYGLLVGQKEAVTLSGGFNLAGDFGVGQGATVKFSGANAIAGTEFTDTGVKTTGNANRRRRRLRQHGASNHRRDECGDRRRRAICDTGTRLSKFVDQRERRLDHDQGFDEFERECP